MPASRQPDALSASAAVVMPVIGIALVLVVAVAALIGVPGFVALFTGFGGELPGSTRLLLATYRGWALGVVPVILVWLIVPGRRSRAVVTLLTGVAIATGLLLFGAWACYSPIVGMAMSVG